MRVTSNSSYIHFSRNLEEIQTRKYQEELRISTGNKIINISDDPANLESSKRLAVLIKKNQEYKDNLEEVLSELRAVSSQGENMRQKISDIRDQALSSFSGINHANLVSVGVYMKGILTDLIKDANSDFNGHYMFSGTKTTPTSIDRTGTQNDLPFELIEGEHSAENWSGLKVIFKGNNNSRMFAKDNQTSENINMKAEDLFGKDSTALFDNIIKLYNILTYNSGGMKRNETDVFSPEESDKINQYQKTLAENMFSLDSLISGLGGKINRFEATSGQISEEIIRLQDLHGLKTDTDIVRSTINLKKEESALQYSLQVGSQIMQNTLFDFLT